MSRHGPAFIRATPNPIPYAPGRELGTITVEWSTGDNATGWVCVSVVGGEELGFAADQAGSREVTWIESGVAYRFTLYADEARTEQLDSVVVTTERKPVPPPFIRATPNPIPYAPGLETSTTLEWSTGDGSPGWVYVSIGGAVEHLFAAVPDGSQVVPWIAEGVESHFTLYADEARTEQLDSVVVTTERKPALPPFIRATPNPIPYASRPAFDTTLEWSTGDGSPGWVYVSIAGAEEKLVAAVPAGSRNVPWIAEGSECRFTLYADAARTRELDSIVVTTEREPAPPPYIRATPNPIPYAPGPEASTTLEWSTGDGSPGWVYVSFGGAVEKLFAAVPVGSQVAPWLARGVDCRFTLYADEGRTEALDSVVVTTERGPIEKPFIRATPNPVPYAPGAAPGTTTMEWSTGDGSPGWVYVSVDGAEEVAFSTMPAGRVEAIWIKRSGVSRFTLYADEQRTQTLASVTVTTERPPPTKPFVRGVPNPIPPQKGPELGHSRVEWSTGDGSPGWVFLRSPGGQESAFGVGAEGAVFITWVLRDYAYRFTLYADPDRKKKLAAVTIAMGSPTREVLIDLAVLALAAGIVMTPVAFAVWLVTRLW